MSMAPLFLALMLSLGAAAPQDDAVRITIARVESPTAKPTNPEFAITLENQSDGDFVVVLGQMLGNGNELLPYGVSLLLTDQNGRPRTLRLRLPGVVGGTVSDYIVPLRKRAAYVLRVSLTEYDGLGELGPTLPSGTYSVQATFNGGMANYVVSIADLRRREKLLPGSQIMNLWTGEAVSNELRFSVP